MRVGDIPSWLNAMLRGNARSSASRSHGIRGLGLGASLPTEGARRSTATSRSGTSARRSFLDARASPRSLSRPRSGRGGLSRAGRSGCCGFSCGARCCDEDFSRRALGSCASDGDGADIVLVRLGRRNSLLHRLSLAPRCRRSADGGHRHAGPAGNLFHDAAGLDSLVGQMSREGAAPVRKRRKEQLRLDRSCSRAARIEQAPGMRGERHPFGLGCVVANANPPLALSRAR